MRGYFFCGVPGRVPQCGQAIMPSRKKGGRHQTRKQIKHGGPVEKRDLMFREDGQVYAMVTNIFGQGRFELQCSDGTQRMGILRGALHKRAWIRKETLVLASLRDYQDDKADIFHVFNHDEFRQLMHLQEVPTSWLHMGTADLAVQDTEKQDDGIDFDEI